MPLFFPPKKQKQPDLTRFLDSLEKDVQLGAQSWFKCGGKAELLFKPKDIVELSEFVKIWPMNQPLTVIGGLANTIIRDGGISGVTIQLGRALSKIQCYANGKHIEVECGALNGSVAAAAVKNSIGGLEFLSGIPGTLGGAIAMNAGAYGSDISDILVGITVVNQYGEVKKFSRDDLQFSYRHCFIPENSIVVKAVLKGAASDYDTVKSKITEIKQKRNETQPIRDNTGGSTFANPSPAELENAGLESGLRAWQIVEKVGGRGLQICGAKMSDKHCNFMVNTGDATASNLEDLGEELRRRAKEELGLNLKWEIKRIGQR